jgi:signal transduction histidine kinase
MLDALAEFAAGAGHEINNPLSIINGRAKLLLNEITDAEQRRQLEIIVTQTLRASEMIADVRFFARPPQPEIETFDLQKELETVIGEQSALLEEPGIKVYFTFDKKTQNTKIASDPVLLHTAVMLLCNNARESLTLSGIQGNIRIHAGYADGFWTITVEDDGGGIDDEVVPHIFEPFYSGRQAGRGLGFGLPKVWRIMTLLGGNVCYENTNRGAKFLLRIPAELY